MPYCCPGSEVRSGRLVGDHRKARVIQKATASNPGLQKSNKNEARLHFRLDRFSVSLCTANKTPSPRSVEGKQIVPLKYTVLMRFLRQSFFFPFSGRRKNSALPFFRDLISLCFPLLFLYFFSSNTAESIKKIVDKSSIKFIHAVKLDTKTGKTEDRILVRSSGSVFHGPAMLRSL